MTNETDFLLYRLRVVLGWPKSERKHVHLHSIKSRLRAIQNETTGVKHAAI